MKILFLNMLSVSFFTTVFIGLFCLICRAVNRRWVSALTWTVGIFVGLRLLFFVPVPLPYTITFPEGMQMELPKTLLEQRREEYLEEKEKEKLEARENGQKQAESVREWLTRQTEALTEGNPGFPAGLFSAEALSEVFLSAAAWIWFAVCLFLIVFRFAGYFRLRFLIFRKGKPLTEAENGIYRRCVNELRYGINIRVKRLAGISSPFGIGYFSQMIIIPEGLTDAEALENVFLHEIIHARRFDNWYRLLLVLAQSVHWFNPAAALFFRKIERAREYLCDRAATEQRGPGDRKAYCESILAVMEMTGENKARKRRSIFTFIRTLFSIRPPRSIWNADMRMRPMSRSFRGFPEYGRFTGERARLRGWMKSILPLRPLRPSTGTITAGNMRCFWTETGSPMYSSSSRSRRRSRSPRNICRFIMERKRKERAFPFICLMWETARAPVTFKNVYFTCRHFRLSALIQVHWPGGFSSVSSSSAQKTDSSRKRSVAEKNGEAPFLKKRCQTYRLPTALAIAAASGFSAGITIADGKKVYKRCRNSFQRMKNQI